MESGQRSLFGYPDMALSDRRGEPSGSGYQSRRSQSSCQLFSRRVQICSERTRPLRAGRNPNSDIPTIVNGVPNVDIWGLNVYRGASFGTLFAQWKNVTSKPFYISEFGTDSFKTTQFTQPFTGCSTQSGEAQVQAGVQDQATQASENDVGTVE